MLTRFCLCPSHVSKSNTYLFSAQYSEKGVTSEADTERGGASGAEASSQWKTAPSAALGGGGRRFEKICRRRRLPQMFSKEKVCRVFLRAPLRKDLQAPNTLQIESCRTQ